LEQNKHLNILERLEDVLIEGSCWEERNEIIPALLIMVALICAEMKKEVKGWSEK
jgi:hypothetical protein